MIEPSAIYTLWLREIKRFLRSRSRIIGNLSMPFMWLVLFGSGLGGTMIPISGSSVNYMEFIGPGVICMTLLFTSVFSGISIIWDRQFGFLKEILVAPIGRTSIVLGKIAGSSTISVFNGVVMLIAAILLGAVPPASLTLVNIGAALAIMVLTSAAFVAIGMAIASQMGNTEGFQLIMNFLVMPIFFLSGALFPLNSAPGWMSAISRLDPLTYGVDAMRGVLIGTSMFPVHESFTILVAFCAAMVLVSAYLFREMKA